MHFFQTALKEMRIIDDKIVYAINQSIPTASFKGQSDAIQNCKELHQTVSDSTIQSICLYTKYSMKGRNCFLISPKSIYG